MIDSGGYRDVRQDPHALEKHPWHYLYMNEVATRGIDA